MKGTAMSEWRTQNRQGKYRRLASCPCSGIRRGCMGGGALRALQTVESKEFPAGPCRTAPAGVRIEASRPYWCRAGPVLVLCAISRADFRNADLGLKPFRQIMGFAVALARSVEFRSCSTQGPNTYPPDVHEPRPSGADHYARMAVGIRQRTEH